MGVLNQGKTLLFYYFSIDQNYFQITSWNVFIWLLTLFLTIYMLYLIQQYMISPLRFIPGPYVPILFPFWPGNLIDSASGRHHRVLLELHQKYGPIVRLGCNVISVNDPALCRQVLSVLDIPKGPLYDKLAFMDLPPTIFNDRDKEHHRLTRRFLSPAFSIKYIQELAPLMLSVYDRFKDKILKLSKEKGDSDGWVKIDIWKETHAISLDIIGETAFGSHFNMVNDPNAELPKLIRSILISLLLKAIAPKFSHSILRKIIPGIPSKEEAELNTKTVLDFCSNLIKNRRKDNVIGEQQKQQRKDILNVLVNAKELDSVGEGQNGELSELQITSSVLMFLGAGSETTGSSISFTLISLLKHPNVFEKLTKVLLEAPLTPSHQISEEIYKDHISAQTAKDLPYLNAVINETLRYFPVAAGALPRENDIDIILNNYLIPKGTSILISLFAVMRGSSELNVVDEWSIDKWLEESSSSSSPSSSSSIHGLGEEKEISSFMPFSLGSRNCIGKNFALQELRLIIANLIRDFELKEMNPPSILEDFNRFTLCIKGESYPLLIRPRRIDQTIK